jgi:alpha-galactosidase
LYHEGIFGELRAPEFKVALKSQKASRRVYEITEGPTRFILVAERTQAWRGQYLQDEEGKRHDFAWEVEMCVVLEKCDESCVLTLSAKLEELLKKSSVTMVRENLKEITHYEGLIQGTDLIFSPSALTPQSLSNEELDHFYAPVEYKVDGVPVVVKMRNFVTACTEALTRNINVFLCGKPGTGKTRLATFVMGQLTLSDENVTILNINAAILEAICGRNSYQFIQFLDRHAKGENKVVIYIDDAHKALNNMHDELKSMLDGTYSNHYNLAVLASMNESSDTLQREKGDLSRPGRVSTFDIKPLTAQQANMAAAFIAANPLMKRIGKSSFTKETTLAVLWDSFVKKEKPNPFKILASGADEPVTISV